MGRKKVTIKRLETAKSRQNKYSKRKTGILKKAKELSVLCDVDLALIMFSPSGKPSLYVGQNKALLNVVDRLSRISIKEQEERRGYTIEIESNYRKATLYVVELIRKLYANTDEDLRSILLDKSELLKLQQNHLSQVKEKIDQKTKILNEWKNPQNIKDLDKIQIMENHLFVSLENIRAKKIALTVQEQGQDQLQGIEASQGEVKQEEC